MYCFHCAGVGSCVEWGNYIHGNDFRLYRPSCMSDCRCASRWTWACRDQRLRSCDLHVCLRLSAGQAACGCNADHSGGGHLRGLLADLGRTYSHAQVCGEVPAQQSETRYDSRAAHDVVSHGALRYGARRLHHVPDHLRHCDQAGHSPRASDGGFVRCLADGDLRLAGFGRRRLDGCIPLCLRA